MRKHFVLQCVLLLFGVLPLIAQQPALVRKDGATIRQEPNKAGKLVVTVPKWTSVSVIDVKADPETEPAYRWHKVEVGRAVGWIQGVFLFLIKADGSQNLISAYQARGTGLKLNAVYRSDYAQGTPPELRLVSDGTFRLSINQCVGMYQVRGQYLTAGDRILLYHFTPPKELPDPITRIMFEQMTMEFQEIDATSLTLLTDVVYDDGIERYGFCSPNQGETFLID